MESIQQYHNVNIWSYDQISKLKTKLILDEIYFVPNLQRRHIRNGTKSCKIFTALLNRRYLLSKLSSWSQKKNLQVRARAFYYSVFLRELRLVLVNALFTHHQITFCLIHFYKRGDSLLFPLILHFAFEVWFHSQLLYFQSLLI